MKHNFKQHQKIYFVGELLPYEIKAINDRYAVCVRPLDKHHDDDLLRHKVKMKAYSTVKLAYEKLKDYPVYSLVDFHEEKRAADNYGCKFEYETQKGCDVALRELVSGKVELSRRSIADLIIDIDRTNSLDMVGVDTPPKR